MNPAPVLTHNASECYSAWRQQLPNFLCAKPDEVSTSPSSDALFNVKLSIKLLCRDHRESHKSSAPSFIYPGLVCEIHKASPCLAPRNRPLITHSFFLKKVRCYIEVTLCALKVLRWNRTEPETKGGRGSKETGSLGVTPHQSRAEAASKPIPHSSFTSAVIFHLRNPWQPARNMHDTRSQMDTLWH